MNSGKYTIRILLLLCETKMYLMSTLKFDFRDQKETPFTVSKPDLTFPKHGYHHHLETLK